MKIRDRFVCVCSPRCLFQMKVLLEGFHWLSSKKTTRSILSGIFFAINKHTVEKMKESKFPIQRHTSQNQVFHKNQQTYGFTWKKNPAATSGRIHQWDCQSGVGSQTSKGNLGMKQLNHIELTKNTLMEWRSFKYPFLRDQTMHIYGNFEGFPLWWCIACVPGRLISKKIGKTSHLKLGPVASCK